MEDQQDARIQFLLAFVPPGYVTTAAFQTERTPPNTLTPLPTPTFHPSWELTVLSSVASATFFFLYPNPGGSRYLIFILQVKEPAGANK